MKKTLFTILIISMCLLKINASGMTFDLSCPSGAAASSTISCSVVISSTTQNSLCAIAAKLSINNGTFVNFTPKVSLFQNTSNGFTFNTDNNCISSKILFGTLNVKMPSSGNLTIKYSGIEASDSTGTIKSTANDVQKIIRVYDDNCNLSSLSITSKTFTPAFNSNTTSYSLNVESNVTSITINASPEKSTSKVTGTGNKTLSYGENKFVIVVKSEAGTTKNYNIYVNRKDDRNTDNNLSNLNISNYKLNKDFQSSLTSYTAKVPANVKSIQVNATLSDNKASFVKGFGPRTVDLKYGINSIEVKVSAENQKQKSYLIKVTREDDRSSNNYLKSLNVKNSRLNFIKDTLVYNISVRNDVNEVEIQAEAEDEKAKVIGAGTIKLTEGNNVAKVIVKAENELEKTYTINIKKLSLTESLSSNTNLSNLKISNYEIDFSKDKLDYVIKLKDEKKLNIITQTEDDTSKVEIIGNEKLTDNSLIKINVTSTDGSLKTYNLIIDKEEIIIENNNKTIYLIIIIFETLIITLLTFYIIGKLTSKEEKVTNNKEIKEESSLDNQDTIVNESSQITIQNNTNQDSQLNNEGHE